MMKRQTNKNKMRKIGIISFITHSSHLNYGATLHGYAFQQYLKKRYGIDTIIIKYIPKALIGENLKYPILNPKGNRTLANYLLVKLNWLIGFGSNLSKWNKFKNFIDKYLTTTQNTYTYQNLRKVNKIDNMQFDMFVCEADVIWKIFDLNSIDENFFLSFPAAKNTLKVAYAPTIGSKPLEGELLEKFKMLTSSFIAISAREQYGAVYLSQLLNRDVTSVLDPTLLLNEEDYNKILVEPKEKKYLLIYNCTVNDIEMVRTATKYGKERKLKVIEISNYVLNRYIIKHDVRTDVGIEEWLGYIKYATVIFTNSFHGLCFSVIFKTDIYLFQRDNRDFRMQNIVESLGIPERLISCDMRKTPLEQKNINYDAVYGRLALLRKQSDDFLRDNIVR